MTKFARIVILFVFLLSFVVIAAEEAPPAVSEGKFEEQIVPPETKGQSGKPPATSKSRSKQKKSSDTQREENQIEEKYRDIKNAISNKAGKKAQFTILAVATFGFVVTGVFLFLIWKEQNKKKTAFSDIFRRLDELNTKKKDSSDTGGKVCYPSRGKSAEEVGGDVKKCVKESIDNLQNSLRVEMGTSGLFNKLSKCEERLEEISTNCARFDAFQKTLIAINEEHPDLVNVALTDAVRLLKECHRLEIAKAEQLQSVYQAACERNDYDEQLQATKQQLNSVEQKSSKTYSELQHSNELLALYRPEEFAAVQEKMLTVMQGLQSDVVAAVIAQVLQFYWFVRSFANDESKIKTAFVRLDDTLFELVGNKQDQEILQEVRNAIEGYINLEIFKKAGSAYSIMWPKLGAPASEHADEWYSRENDTGNTICKVRSALIRKNGQVVSLARVYTSA
jgi:hypothetical protein